MTDVAEIKCIVCEKPATKKCGDCGAVAYCSAECQVKHWTTHKQWCKKIRAVFVKLEEEEEEVDDKSRMSCVGMPKRKKETVKSVDAPPEPEAKRMRLALEEAANDLAVIPSDQRTPELVVEQLANAGVVIRRSDWKKQKALLAGLLFGRPSETVLSGRTLSVDVLNRITELALESPVASSIGIYKSGEGALKILDLLSDAGEAREISIKLPLVQIHFPVFDDNDDMMMIGRDTLAFKARRNKFIAMKLDPNGKVLRSVVVPNVLAARIVYIPRVHKIAVSARGRTRVVLVDSLTLRKTKGFESDPDQPIAYDFAVFGDEMLCCASFDTGKIIVLGQSNRWKSPLFEFKIPTTLFANVSFCRDMILTPGHSPNSLAAHYFSRVDGTFASTTYEIEKTGSLYRVMGTVPLVVSGGMCVMGGVTGDGMAARFEIAAPPLVVATAAAIPALPIQRFVYGFPVPLGGKYYSINVRSQCTPAMDNVAVLCPGWAFPGKPTAPEAVIIWFIRDPIGRVKSVGTILDIDVNDPPHFHRCFALGTNPNIAALISFRAFGDLVFVHVVNVDTGVLMKTVDLNPTKTTDVSRVIPIYRG